MSQQLHGGFFADHIGCELESS
eukprot:COSAG06_NODE_31744_length_516_cov_1.095923_1_plen_21_part_01